MEIITYTIGVLIGLVPILVDLGPSRAPAQVLLDGKVVCSVTAEAPGCVADLETAPRLNPSVVLAGTPAGLFARVGESPWKRIDEAPGHVTAIAVDRERRVFVGTARPATAYSSTAFSDNLPFPRSRPSGAGSEQ